jgi:hypothetical protein
MKRIKYNIFEPQQMVIVAFDPNGKLDMKYTIRGYGSILSTNEKAEELRDKIKGYNFVVVLEKDFLRVMKKKGIKLGLYKDNRRL